MALRVSNPVLTQGSFERAGRESVGTSQLTIGGVIAKTAYLCGVAGLAASITWSRVGGEDPQAVYPWMIGGLIITLVLGLVMAFVPRSVPFLATPYAAAEGLFLGAISALANARYPGIASTALFLTFGATAAVLAVWRSGLVRGGGVVMKIVTVSTVAIGLVYLASMLFRLFGMGGFDFLFDSSPLGIGVGVFICVIASLNLVHDFEFIEGRAKEGAPKALEWRAAFGVLVTLVWMYIEFLGLLLKLRRR
jgi:uncharacterized YccA/Bax inhibitor family protein